MEYYVEAAIEGLVEAQYKAGYLYSKGLGTARNHKEAVRWFRQAALQGHCDSQYLLAGYYAIGVGVAQDY